jgi:tetracycline 7-halogenase / FADH2 O2-dependent halogenase
MRTDFDIAIVGSGFGGSLLAMIARRLGRSVVLLERGQHPRFAIGESSTPLANLLLEELAGRYDLPQVASLAKWGTWQTAHPEIACGLKRGFTFYHHLFDQPWTPTPQHGNELLVAASPHDRVADTHWYRPDFDQFLVNQTRQLGVEFLDQVQLDHAAFSEQAVELTGRRVGNRFMIRAKFVVDASGPRGFLHRALGLSNQSFASFPKTQGLYTHFEGVRRWEELHPPTEPPPYPVDDAAMHHVFEGGWIWVLRFNNGITSAGVAATDALAGELGLAEGAPGWDRLLARLPSVQEQFNPAIPSLPFMHAPRLTSRSAQAAGERWALLPSAAGFVDPLLSTGFPLTLLGIGRLAELLEKNWETARLPERLRVYEEQTFAELEITAALVGSLYANMDDFERFTGLTLLYFAAAMYTETGRRLGSVQAANGFLLHDHPKFGPALRSCVERARRGASGIDQAALIKSILQTIEPINLAALGNANRRNWYPCRGEDLLAAAPKLKVDRAAIEQLLKRCGFVQ